MAPCVDANQHNSFFIPSPIFSTFRKLSTSNVHIILTLLTLPKPREHKEREPTQFIDEPIFL